MTLPKLVPNQIVPLFDEFLAKRGVTLEAVIIGAGALHLMNVISRLTIDLDILSPKLSDEILELSRKFREEMNSKGIPLIEEWINNGPSSLIRDLPSGWENNTQSYSKVMF